jgi:hypothetical protein
MPNSLIRHKHGTSNIIPVNISNYYKLKNKSLILLFFKIHKSLKLYLKIGINLIQLFLLNSKLIHLVIFIFNLT